jgi:hypothetical protein
LKQHRNGFSDALFPNIGYTFLLNLSTPLVVQVGDKKFELKTDGFLPRHKAIECYHQQGNCLFGIIPMNGNRGACDCPIFTSAILINHQLLMGSWELKEKFYVCAMYEAGPGESKFNQPVVDLSMIH